MQAAYNFDSFNVSHHEKTRYLHMQEHQCSCAVISAPLFFCFSLNKLYNVSKNYFNPSFKPSSMTVQADLCCTWLATPKTCYLMSRLIHHFCIIGCFPAYKKSILEKQVTRTPLTSKVRGVLVTCFSNIDFSKAGNQRIMQKW